MSRGCARGLAAGSLLGAALAGCASSPRRPPPLPPPPAAKVGYTVELPQNEGSHRLQRGQSSSRPQARLGEQPLPDYPAAWLSAQLPEQQVLALLSIDAQGRLAALSFPEAEQQWQCPPTQACAKDFLASTRAALQRWHFEPLQIMDWVDGPDTDGDGEADSVRRVATETRPYSLRLRFRFALRDGRGEVSVAR